MSGPHQVARMVMAPVRTVSIHQRISISRLLNLTTPPILAKPIGKSTVFAYTPLILGTRGDDDLCR
jgi:hypothetical protein